MVTNAPWGGKTYGDTKRAEGAGDRQGAGGSGTCKASSKGTVWPLRAQTQETLRRHQLGGPRVTRRHFRRNHMPCLSTAWAGSSLVGSTLVLCLVCQLPLTQRSHSLRALLSALPLAPGCPASGRLRRSFHTELVSARTPAPGASPPLLPTPPIYHPPQGRRHCFRAGQILAAPRAMRYRPLMCSQVTLCWSMFYNHQKLCTGQSHKGPGEQLIGKLPLHPPQMPPPGPSQGQGDRQGTVGDSGARLVLHALLAP